MLTSSTGATEATFTYDAYGNRTGTTGTATTPFGYDGQYGNYLRARIYDSTTAQFLSVDPISPISRAPYSYTYDNPVNYYDPTGLCSINPLSSENCFTEVPNVIGGAVVSGATWAYEHPGQAFEAGAAGVCVVATDGVCAGAVGFALATNTYINVQNPDFLGHEAVTIGETALLGGAGLVKAGLGITGALDGALPTTWLGNAALNASLTWPSVVGIGLEGPIDRAIFCE